MATNQNQSNLKSTWLKFSNNQPLNQLNQQLNLKVRSQVKINPMLWNLINPLLSFQDQKKMKNDSMHQKNWNHWKTNLLPKDQLLNDKTRVLTNQMSVISLQRVLKVSKVSRKQLNQQVVKSLKVQGNLSQETKRNQKKHLKIWSKVLEKEVQRRSKIFKEHSSLIKSKRKRWEKLLKRH